VTPKQLDEIRARMDGVTAESDGSTRSKFAGIAGAVQNDDDVNEDAGSEVSLFQARSGARQSPERPPAKSGSRSSPSSLRMKEAQLEAKAKESKELD